MVDSLPQWLLDVLGQDVQFWLGYLTNGKHLNWYASVQYTLAAGVLGALVALVLGTLAATARNSRSAPVRVLGNIYTSVLPGVPDVLFFLFFPLAFEQAVEWVRAQAICSPSDLGSGHWPPCPDANLILGTPEYLILAAVSLGIVYGAFAGNVIAGAMNAVPKGQLEAARAFGMSPLQVMTRIHIRQMWVYALPGLSNVWMLLFKSTSLLSLLQISDIVLWADRLGAPNFSRSAGFVHPDWRWAYYLILLIFYIIITFISEKVFAALTRWAGRGMATAGAV
ncbi:MAG: ABC transporter permease subunit [Devosia sp.]|uniref:ABC transporter permease subunit n=1 Tax=Devosia sp. TaxID=1871048 RepID=UPI001ACA788A|nr:ABC transporter permease subunit [Devosia sp.]MBN9315513.1 ABC transporter permease subunit [Devosia sp.]